MTELEILSRKKSINIHSTVDHGLETILCRKIYVRIPKKGSEGARRDDKEQQRKTKNESFALSKTRNPIYHLRATKVQENMGEGQKPKTKPSTDIQHPLQILQ